MSPIFRILGLCAYVNYRASRYRGNEIPMNWLIMFLLCLFTALAYLQVQEAYANRGSPHEMTLSAIARGQVAANREVKVTGHLYLDDALSEGDASDKREVGDAWIPLVDNDARAGVYVQASGPLTVKRIHEEAVDKIILSRPTEIVGVLRKIDGALGSELRARPRRVGQTAMNDQWMIVAGAKPMGLVVSVAIMAGLGVPLLTILILIIARNTVFIPGEGTIAAISAKPTKPEELPPLDLRVTGVFTLAKYRQRFLEVGSVLAELETGQGALLANVDASVQTMGQVTSQRAGTWAVVIRQGSVGKPRAGAMYWAWNSRPALRISYIDDLSGKRRRMIVSFADEEQRNRFGTLLAEAAAGQGKPGAVR